MFFVRWHSMLLSCFLALFIAIVKICFVKYLYKGRDRQGPLQSSPVTKQGFYDKIMSTFCFLFRTHTISISHPFPRSLTHSLTLFLGFHAIAIRKHWTNFPTWHSQLSSWWEPYQLRKAPASCFLRIFVKNLNEMKLNYLLS